MYDTIYGVPYAYELERPMQLAVHVYPRIARRSRQDAPGRAEGKENGKLDLPAETERATRNGNPINVQPTPRRRRGPNGSKIGRPITFCPDMDRAEAKRIRERQRYAEKRAQV